METVHVFKAPKIQKNLPASTEKAVETPRRGPASKILTNHAKSCQATKTKAAATTKAAAKPKSRPKKRKIETQQDLTDYRTEWYAYLKAKGFNDIEKYCPETGYTDFGMLFGSGKDYSIKNNYSPEKEYYFNMMRNSFLSLRLLSIVFDIYLLLK